MSVKSGGTSFWVNLILGRCMDPVDKVLLLYMADYINSDDECWMDQGDLAMLAAVSERTVQRRTSFMAREGWLTKNQERWGNSGLFMRNVYRLHRDIINDLPCVFDDCHTVGQPIRKGSKKRPAAAPGKG